MSQMIAPTIKITPQSELNREDGLCQWYCTMFYVVLYNVLCCIVQCFMLYCTVLYSIVQHTVHYYLSNNNQTSLFYCCHLQHYNIFIRNSRKTINYVYISYGIDVNDNSIFNNFHNNLFTYK